MTWDLDEDEEEEQSLLEKAQISLGPHQAGRQEAIVEGLRGYIIALEPEGSGSHGRQRSDTIR